ncbi:MAG TPA: hypothetical protein DIT66_01305 [Rhodobiaceae bacterium]|nr:hypothetical protein [Rhodobiaceae bacterium]
MLPSFLGRQNILATWLRAVSLRIAMDLPPLMAPQLDRQSPGLRFILTWRGVLFSMTVKQIKGADIEQSIRY